MAIILLLLVLVAGIIFWLKRPGAIPVRAVLVREAVGNGIERTVLNASGYVTARRQATVSSKVTGQGGRGAH